MPIYEYICNDCNNGFEALVFGGKTPDCPQCNGTNIKKQMSACSFKSPSSTAGEPAKTSASSSACSGCSATTCGSCSSG